MPSKIAAIVVTFQPGEEVGKTVRALLPQVSAVLVIDNGSHPENLKRLRALCGTAEVLSLDRNEGIAHAHNVGIARARQLAATHVLLMDQDSLASPDMVSGLLATEKRLLDEGLRVGAVGPVYHDHRLAKSWPFFRMSRFGVKAHACRGEDHVACDFLISSGTLIRTAVVDDVGCMNEGYFLEHVDTEWSLRARYKGYGLYGACHARMDHRLGDDTVAVPFTERRVQLYKPYRHYYLFRNSVLLWRERHAPLAWKLNEIKRLLVRLLFFPVFVAPRRQRLRYMLLGLWHGLRGRTGPLEA